MINHYKRFSLCVINSMVIKMYNCILIVQKMYVITYYDIILTLSKCYDLTRECSSVGPTLNTYYSKFQCAKHMSK